MTFGSSLYLSGLDDDTLLKPVQSPLFERAALQGNNNRPMPPDGVTAAEWVRIRFGSINAYYANNKDNKVVVRNVEVPT